MTPVGHMLIKSRSLGSDLSTWHLSVYQSTLAEDCSLRRFLDTVFVHPMISVWLFGLHQRWYPRRCSFSQSDRVNPGSSSSHLKVILGQCFDFQHRKQNWCLFHAIISNTIDEVCWSRGWRLDKIHLVKLKAQDCQGSLEQLPCRSDISYLLHVLDIFRWGNWSMMLSFGRRLSNLWHLLASVVQWILTHTYRSTFSSRLRVCCLLVALLIHQSWSCTFI